MKLELEDGRSVEHPSPGVIAEMLQQMRAEGNGYAILSRDEMTYIQASGDGEIAFVVEYQEGDTDHHFIATNEAVPLETVITMFQSYAAGGEAWREMCQWKPSDLGRADEKVGCAAKSTAVIIAIALAGALASAMLAR